MRTSLTPPVDLTDDDLKALNATLDASGAVSLGACAGTVHAFTMRESATFDEAGTLRH